MKTITICGSMRFWRTMYLVHDFLSTDEGALVFLPIKVHAWDDNTIKNLHKLHELKIQNSDEIFVVDTTGHGSDHVGEDTKREIDYAVSNGIPVRFLSKCVNVLERVKNIPYSRR